MKKNLQILQLIEAKRNITMNKALSEDLLKQFESNLMTELPLSFHEYLLLCDGQKEDNENPLLSAYYFLSLNRIKEIMERNISLFFDEPEIDWVKENKIKPVIWDALWIPFAMNIENNSYLILDLNPGKYGTVGQIIWVYPGSDLEGNDSVLATSFDEFSKNIYQRLENKEYRLKDNLIMFNDYYF